MAYESLSRSARDISALRRELAIAERELHARVQSAAAKIADAEHLAWLDARDACHAYDRIRPIAQRRIAEIGAGSPERFRGEKALAEMALRDACEADAAYTLLSFGSLRDRLRFLLGGTDRQAVIREVGDRGGVYTEANGGRYFQEIVR